MVFQLQQISNYGTSTPAVARTLFQGAEILGFFAVTSQARDEAKEVLHEVQRLLLRCVAEVESFQADLTTARNELQRNGLLSHGGGGAVTLPSVVDTQSRAESFLQSAKLAIAQAARLFTPFYKVEVDHRYHKISAWAEAHFGRDDPIAQALRSWEPWVKRVVSMRNAVDHPKGGPGGKLVTRNFTLTGQPGAYSVLDPAWGLTGESMSLIAPDMNSIVEGIIELQEEFLVGLFYKLKQPLPLVLYEIPSDQRDPKCPIRLRVGLRPEGVGA